MPKHASQRPISAADRHRAARELARRACQAACAWHIEGLRFSLENMERSGLDLDAFNPNAQSAAMACARHRFTQGLLLCVQMGCDLAKPGRGGQSAADIVHASIASRALLAQAWCRLGQQAIAVETEAMLLALAAFEARSIDLSLRLATAAAPGRAATRL